MIIYEYDGHLHFTKELNFSKPYNSLYSVNLNNPVIIYFNNETYIHWKKNFSLGFYSNRKDFIAGSREGIPFLKTNLKVEDIIYDNVQS